MKFFVNFFNESWNFASKSSKHVRMGIFFKNVSILLIKRELYRFILKIPFMQTHSKNVF